MEKILAKRILSQLKIIKGKISIHFATGCNDYLNDMIIVDIANGRSVFHYTYDNIQDAICRGLTSDTIARDICKQYRKWILNQYFYTQN